MMAPNSAINCLTPQTPPQTYSRLFRPWDGKTNHQDNRISSSTTPKKCYDNGNESNEKVSTHQIKRRSTLIQESVEIINDIELKKQKQQEINNKTIKINQRLFDLSPNPHNQQQQLSPTINKQSEYFSIENIHSTVIPSPQSIDEMTNNSKNSNNNNNNFHHEQIYNQQHQNDAAAIAFYSATKGYPEFMTGISYLDGGVQTNYVQPPGGVMMPDSLAVSAATAVAMEQEYARVLAEEAHAKMLSARKQRPKKFKCTHCNVAFSNNGQLKGHIRIHTGERPFKCDEANCGKTFTRNEELTRHKRIHTGLRPYACSHCGKRFGRRDHLKKHTKTHFIQERYMAAQSLFLPLYPYLYGF